MLERKWVQWIAGIGLLLAVAGLGFMADADPPFVKGGMLIGLIGLACFLVVGWVDFGRKSQW